MILSHRSFENPLEISEDAVSVLRVENQKQLSAYISELKQQLGGGAGNFILSEGGKEIDISNRVIMAIDVFSLDLNERSILNKLYSKMSTEAHDETNYLLTSELISHLEKYLYQIAKQQPFPIIFSENIEIINIFKLAEVRFLLSEDSLLEKVCDFVTVCANYVKPKLFIFVNLKNFLTKDDLMQLYSFVFYNKHKLLLIEGTSSETIPCERTRIIDADRCEIELLPVNINYSEHS